MPHWGRAQILYPRIVAPNFYNLMRFSRKLGPRLHPSADGGAWSRRERRGILFLPKIRRELDADRSPRGSVEFDLHFGEWQMVLERHRHPIPIFPSDPASPGLPRLGGLGISCSANGTVWLITSTQWNFNDGRVRPGRRIFQQPAVEWGSRVCLTAI